MDAVAAGITGATPLAPAAGLSLAARRYFRASADEAYRPYCGLSDAAERLRPPPWPELFMGADTPLAEARWHHLACYQRAVRACARRKEWRQQLGRERERSVSSRSQPLPGPSQARSSSTPCISLNANPRSGPGA